MDKNYIVNACLKAPGLAIGSGGKTTFKYGNTFAVKANGVISDDTTTADAPALTASKGVNNAASTSLAIGYSRVYTLLASVNTSTGVITFSLVHGDDFVTRPPKMSDINFGNPQNQDELKAVCGFVVINNATNLFVPGTTALDAAGVTVQYIDNYGFVGV